MRQITSPLTFKTCYIAEVKEEMGRKTKGRMKKRKVLAPAHIKPFIRKAIERLGPGATYRDIQQEALRIYQEQVSGEIEKYHGLFKMNDSSLVRQIAEDKGIYYGIEDLQGIQ